MAAPNNTPTGTNWNSILSQTYSSFTGSDLFAVFGNELVVELISISISQSREIAPAYTSGSYRPRGFNKGKFATGGSFTLSFFDRDPLLMRIFAKQGPGGSGIYGRTLGEIYGYQAAAQFTVSNNNFERALTSQLSQTQSNSLQQTLRQHGIELQQAVAGRLLTNPTQLPPFDITITFLNEIGSMSFCAVLGVQVINTARGWSVDDMMTEQPYTYLAIDATPVIPITEATGKMGEGFAETFSQVPSFRVMAGLTTPGDGSTPQE